MRKLTDRKDVRNLGGPIAAADFLFGRIPESVQARQLQPVIHISRQFLDAIRAELSEGQEPYGTVNRIRFGRFTVFASPDRSGMSISY
jgi:hypothetical protein